MEKINRFIISNIIFTSMRGLQVSYDLNNISSSTYKSILKSPIYIKIPFFILLWSSLPFFLLTFKVSEKNKFFLAKKFISFYPFTKLEEIIRPISLLYIYEEV